ncbi:D-2-hydroxyacid dehydrogenase [Salinigranum halophilum]|jgi:phosphoglycerate dehydrogenase-like enzyme|uniref:D-2-hydroxyacid dehydrogenase n=1 Tax=Salinigranum halophilum TaxID=2565931 RepID=UPI0010A761EF|nr:D-2-hydroxyacid dehydrogenase [Salinigranum halophilum]
MGSTPQVLVTNEFPPETTGTAAEFVSAVRERLPEVDVHLATDYADTARRVRDAEIVVEHGFDHDLLEHATDLRWINTLSSGADSYDLDVVTDLDATLTTVSGVHARPIAEHVFALMLHFERGLGQGHEQQRRHEWCRFSAGELGTQTLGIVGVGSIGGRVAELGAAFGMDVLGVRRNPSKPHPAVDELFAPEERHEPLGRSDYVVVACPLTDETEGLIGSEEFSSLSKDAVLVNVSRGEVVDQRALVEQLRTGYIGGAALDVAETEPLPRDSPLWDLSNVVLTPHMAGGSPAFPRRCAELFVENYRHFVEGRPEDMRNRIV